jgi:hypothetical protein
MSKINNMKNSFSFVDNKENSKVKKSGYLIGSGLMGFGQHKKSASQVQMQISSYNLKSPGKDKPKEEIQIIKKNSSNYFFKKPKSKQPTEEPEKASRIARLGSRNNQKVGSPLPAKF